VIAATFALLVDEAELFGVRSSFPARKSFTKLHSWESFGWCYILFSAYNVSNNLIAHWMIISFRVSSDKIHVRTGSRLP